jgi:Acetoacetate decarboxylase (ADC)
MLICLWTSSHSVLDHPLVPGPSSAIEKGPWHYGADYVTVYFKGAKANLAGLVPSPFVLDDGLCMAYVCEIVSVSDSGAEMVHTSPERTQYQEAAVGVRCRYRGGSGVYFPVMWVTTEWSLLRGLLNGYPKRLADRISMTKLHPLNPGLRAVAAGARFSGFCVKGSETTLALSVRLDGPGSQSDLPSFGATFGMRRFPRTDPSQGEVDEPVQVLKSNSRSSDVWLGSGEVRSTLDLGEVEPVSGAVYRSGFTISGSSVLER